MSRATHTEHAHHLGRRAEAGADRAPDLDALDAEHDPGIARRASLAGLRREAAAPRGPGAGAAVTPAAAGQQHEAAQRASFDGIQAALILGAHRLDGHVDEIDLLISNPGLGGPVRSIDAMAQIFSGARSDLIRLRCELGSLGDRVARKYLCAEVKRLGGAWERFAMAWTRAQSYAGRHAMDLAQNPYWLKQQIDMMFESMGLDHPVRYDGSRDERGSTEILMAAVTSGLDAAAACERAVRMAMATGNDGVATQDLKMMAWHLQEVRASLGQDHEGKARRAVAAQAGKVVKAVRALLAELSSRPELEQAAQGLTSTLDSIATFTGKR